MKINGGSFNVMKALNESAKDELEVKKQVFMEGNKVTVNNIEEKVTYTNKDGEDYKELTKTEYLNLGKKYGEKVNDYKVKEQNGKFYILKSDYEKLTEASFDDKVKAIKKSLKKNDKRLSDKSAETSAKKIAGSMVKNESSLTEDTDTAEKFGIKDNLDKLTNDLMSIEGVTKVDYDLAGLYDNLGFNILVSFDINSNDTAEYFNKKRLMFKAIVKTFEDDGVNIEKEETEDNDTYFYFVAYSTNWNKEPIEETSMEEIRQNSADKGLLEPEAVNEEDEEVYTDFIYELVGGEYSGTYTREEAEKLPILEPELTDNEGMKREELKNQLQFKGYLGPMWNGVRDGKGVIRYETQEVYNALSEETATITEATVSKDLHEVKSQGNIYMLQDNDKYIVGENYNSKEKLIENAEIYNNKEEADKDYLNRCGIKID